eukprot:TRINITY_DN9275_c0_g1_i1.p1 TRINITY_DN9275_c0_g1~~TRINITY_DN9275_c0_g1_i1.p1  ORF type:complete len:215 (-),score=18.56 TRINITY_DN9275_c0_g1_i1:67-711(-)
MARWSEVDVVEFGGWALLLSGILFSVQFAFVQFVPDPPLADANWPAWLAEWRFNLSMADELLFFATLLLVPAVFALYRSLSAIAPIQALLGCGLLSAVVPVHLLLVVVLGRLVYPVYGIELSTDAHKLVFSLYVGGQHMAFLILSIATLFLSLAIRKSALGKPAAYLGFVSAVLDIIGSFPWLVGSGVAFVSQIFFAGWLIILGVTLLNFGKKE